MDNDRLSLRQLDLLKEIGTIGSANAATALADLINKQVEIAVPRVNLVPLENISSLLGASDKLYFVLDIEIRGDMSGRMFLLFSPDDARYLASALLGKPKEELEFNDEMFQSSLKESANILSGAYVAALAEMANMTILTSVPSLAMDMVGAILDFIFIQISQYSEEALLIKTDVKVSGEKLEGLFLLFPSSESLRKLFETFGLSE
jgi:chemotaxis protein CheC